MATSTSAASGQRVVAAEADAVVVAELRVMAQALRARRPLVRRPLVRPPATRQLLARLQVVAAQVAVPEMRPPPSRAIRRHRPRSSTSVRTCPAAWRR